MANDLTDAYEYGVEQRTEGRFRILKLLLILLYILYPVALLVLVSLLHLYQLFALVILTEWMLVFFTWRYVKPEYRYTVVSGRVTFTVLYGARTRKERLTFMIKDCLLIAPLSEEARLAAFAPVASFSALSSHSSPDAYAAVFPGKGGNTVFYFEATERMLKLCRHYNSANTLTGRVRY